MRFRRRSGFTLVETMVAGTIFALGITGIMMGVSSAQAQRRNANLRADAVKLAKHAVDRLVPLSINVCPGSYGTAADLLADNPGGNLVPRATELTCVGTDVSGTGASVPDYPRNDADVLALVAAQTAGADDAVWRVGGGLGGIPTVIFRGEPYRLTWNVVCGMPLPGIKTVQVNVLWSPFATAIPEDRYVSVQFTKGVGF